jgi:hypothetical protein
MPKLPIKPLADHQQIIPSVTDLHCALIGELIATWTTVENYLELLIWAFLEIDEEDGRIITPKMDAVNKIQMIRRFAELHIPDEGHLKEIAALMGKIDGLRIDRNFIVHGTWGTLMPGKVPIAASLRKISEFDQVVSETFPEVRMRALIFESGIARVQLDDLLSRLPTLRNKTAYKASQGASQF